MSALAETSLLLVLAVLGGIAFGPTLVRLARQRRPRRRRPAEVTTVYDPGRERRAERRARELLRSVVSTEEYEMYVELGFLRVPGPADGNGSGGYGYLIYPHRPIIAFDAQSGDLLSEYCVAFHDNGEAATRLPDADDVLAKWMSLHGNERGLIADANMHLPGRQVDPRQVRRDLRRLAEWEAQRARV